MKKIVFLLFIGLGLLSVPTFAQSPLPIHIGIKGGANFTDLSLSEMNLNSKYSAGYFGGAMVRLDLGKAYLQGEVLYSEKKSKIENSAGGNSNITWKSIDVPVLVGYKVLDLSLVNVRVFGGGVYSYVFDDNSSVFNNIQNSTRSSFDKSQMGFQVGAGIDVIGLNVDLRYEGGLSKLSKDFDKRTSSFNLSVGYFFL
ncbi:porin family protein [Flavobacterium sp. NKUCC04_CG]|uniref:porin family protein n=1 Tax=Flavobacterium sp. NKUCC04_CG TaxID=2842121 RepID=UPI001C5B8BD3|nr:porin family protein [Flavobacterium sp. NKUCC04_CG]MBW3520089.1 PorT family protein [Flavobacterium sp. NKUCC04_CG]